jgi:hypothetical protein
MTPHRLPSETRLDWERLGEKGSNLRRFPYFLVAIPAIMVEMRIVSPERRWLRTVLAVLTFLPGVLSFWVGVFLLYFVIGSTLFNNAHTTVGDFLACCPFVGLGIAWIASSVLFWKGRMETACIAAIVGFLLLIALFAIIGF